MRFVCRWWKRRMVLSSKKMQPAQVEGGGLDGGLAGHVASAVEGLNLSQVAAYSAIIRDADARPST